MGKGASRFSKAHLAICVLAAIVAIVIYVLVRADRIPEFSIDVRAAGDAFEGYTLLAPTVDDIGAALDKPNLIYLVGMGGEVVHSWSVLGAVQLAKLNRDGTLFYATRDRSFLERAGLRRIDPFGNVLWYFKGRVDHDFCVLPTGNVLVHLIEDKEAPAIASGKVRSPKLVEVNQQGEVVWEWRGEDHLQELTSLLGITFPKDTSDGKHIYDGAYDWAHNNGCQVIEANAAGALDARFRPGNIILSYCNLNTIAVVDRASGQIVWAWGPGQLDGQHNPMMLKNGRILLFDNGTERGYSRVIELNPVSGEIVWEYIDREGRSPRFFSPFTSGVDPLPNGNVLVCQASYGAPDLATRFYAEVSLRLLKQRTVFSRLFEVNRAKDVVWELITGHRGPLNCGMYQAERYSEADVRALLGAVKSDEAARGRRLKSLPYMR